MNPSNRGQKHSHHDDELTSDETRPTTRPRLLPQSSKQRAAQVPQQSTSYQRRFTAYTNQPSDLRDPTYTATNEFPGVDMYLQQRNVHQRQVVPAMKRSPVKIPQAGSMASSSHPSHTAGVRNSQRQHSSFSIDPRTGEARFIAEGRLPQGSLDRRPQQQPGVELQEAGRQTRPEQTVDNATQASSLLNGARRRQSSSVTSKIPQSAPAVGPQNSFRQGANIGTINAASTGASSRLNAIYTRWKETLTSDLTPSQLGNGRHPDKNISGEQEVFHQGRSQPAGSSLGTNTSSSQKSPPATASTSPTEVNSIGSTSASPSLSNASCSSATGVSPWTAQEIDALEDDEEVMRDKDMLQTVAAGRVKQVPGYPPWTKRIPKGTSVQEIYAKHTPNYVYDCMTPDVKQAVKDTVAVNADREEKSGFLHNRMRYRIERKIGDDAVRRLLLAPKMYPSTTGMGKGLTRFPFLQGEGKSYVANLSPIPDRKGTKTGGKVPPFHKVFQSNFHPIPDDENELGSFYGLSFWESKEQFETFFNQTQQTMRVCEGFADALVAANPVFGGADVAARVDERLRLLGWPEKSRQEYLNDLARDGEVDHERHVRKTIERLLKKAAHEYAMVSGKYKEIKRRVVTPELIMTMRDVAVSDVEAMMDGSHRNLSQKWSKLQQLHSQASPEPGPSNNGNQPNRRKRDREEDDAEDTDSRKKVRADETETPDSARSPAAQVIPSDANLVEHTAQPSTAVNPEDFAKWNWEKELQQSQEVENVSSVIVLGRILNLTHNDFETWTAFENGAGSFPHFCDNQALPGEGDPGSTADGHEGLPTCYVGTSRFSGGVVKNIEQASDNAVSRAVKQDVFLTCESIETFDIVGTQAPIDDSSNIEGAGWDAYKAFLAFQNSL
ncbi:hypothetical protein H2200_010202 [Cladophialophora chaetospira]|uniref:Uncharacterized protein n=1 Tax=Cladophialophora chaetospira TaxID=386627 RepID=A0AA38X2J2_9EURO|nr:hypothetical protein H2200_010202 [Cladophialophora chaetospira]